jgi:hypothetical protein
MAFEIVDIDLDDRSRMRKMLLELGGLLPPPANVVNRARRQSRVALTK